MMTSPRPTSIDLPPAIATPRTLGPTMRRTPRLLAAISEPLAMVPPDTKTASPSTMW